MHYCSTILHRTARRPVYGTTGSGFINGAAVGAALIQPPMKLFPVVVRVVQCMCWHVAQGRKLGCVGSVSLVSFSRNHEVPV